MKCRISIIAALLSTALSGCAFLPGFALWEDPAIYAFSASDVANQISCELQDFVTLQKEIQTNTPANDPNHYKWVLDDQSDVSVKLDLTTDTSGYVDFTGINVAKLGFESFAQFISTTSSVPSLGAKASGKRTRTVEIDFTVSPAALKSQPKKGTKTYNCVRWSLNNNLATHLFMEDWLNKYFYRINDDYQHKPIPNQLKIQQVELSSAIFLAVDISGGATPALAGGGSTFIVPINGLGLDYNPDYQNKVDMTMKMCDNSPTTFTYEKNGKPVYVSVPNPCYKQPTARFPVSLLKEQCLIYSYLSPLLPQVQPPKDIDAGPDRHLVCTKEGFYVPKENPPSSKSLPSELMSGTD